MSMQSAWRYCQNCHAMFYDGYADKGHCPAGGGHVAQGFMFFLPYDLQETQTAQSAWRYCQNCHAMFYDGYADKGHCAAGGGHVAQGFMFFLPHDVVETSTAQSAWRYCQNCHAMFYDGYADKGHCAAGGGHVAQGFMFFLPHDLPASLDFNFSPIVFDGGVPVGGNAHLTIRQDGSYTFSGHFHDSGGTAYNVGLVWAIKDSQNIAYTFQHAGHVAGTFESGSRDDNWTTNNHNEYLSTHWVSIAAGSNAQAKAAANIDLTELSNDVVKVLGTVIDVISVIVA